VLNAELDRALPANSFNLPSCGSKYSSSEIGVPGENIGGEDKGVVFWRLGESGDFGGKGGGFSLTGVVSSVGVLDCDSLSCESETEASLSLSVSRGGAGMGNHG
jgi:hypothetical protein